MKDHSKDIEAISAIDVIPAILDVICRTTGMGFATVARVTDDRWIACAVQDNINFGLPVGGELKVETTLCHEVRNYRQTIVIDNFDEDDKYRDHHTPKMYGLKSYISVPIFLQNGDFYGTLCAIHPEPAHVNNPAILTMFNLYCNLISLHLHNNEQLAQAQAKLSEEKENAVLREQFIAVLGHDLRNPVGVVRNVAQLLQSGRLDEAGIKKFAGTLMNTYGRMIGLIDNLMDFARGRLGTGIIIYPEPVEMEAPLRHVVEELQLAWPDRVIEVTTELNAPVYGDVKRIGQLFSNLLSNALSHGSRDTPVKVLITNNSCLFELRVTNNGKPIPGSIMKNLFEPFSRGVNDQREQEGLGLGLFISAQIARAHGGTLTVDSNDFETNFAFKMPANRAS